MKKICIMALGLLALPAFANNNNGFYLGAGAISIKDYQDGIEDMSRIKGAEIFGGYKYNDALGIEVRLGSGKTTGTTSYSLGINDADGKLTDQRHVYAFERKIDSYQSIYYRPEMVNDEAKLYALIGYSFVSTSGTMQDSLTNFADGKWSPLSTTSHKSDGSHSGFSYGLGVGFVIDEHFNLNFEYRNICNDISGKPNLININLDYRF